MFKIIRHSIPPKVWMRATDMLCDYRHIGREWIEAGKPYIGELYDEFCRIEKENNQMADAIWFAKWSDSQRREWKRILANTEAEVTYA